MNELQAAYAATLGEPIDDDRSPFPGNAAGTGNTPSDDRSPFPTHAVGNGEQLPEHLFVDVKAMLNGTLPEPPKPVLLQRTDGHACFYAREVNWLFGDSEAGKTLVALAAVTEALLKRRRVLVVDLDHNGPQATVARLVAFGAPLEILSDLDYFRYIEPADAYELSQVIANATVWRPAVALVDSVGELLPALGLSSNSPDDFTLAHSRVLKPLAMTGAAVLAIDHLAKNTDSRNSGPTGTTAKRRAIGGISLRVHAIEAFTPGRGGKAVLTINKDRHGGLRRHCPTGDREPLAGTFVLEDHDGELSWRVAAPRHDDTVPVIGVDPLDLAELDRLDPPAESVRDVKDRLHWRTERAADALREWRSRVPHSGVGEQGTVCRACGLALPSDLPGDTHITCTEAA